MALALRAVLLVSVIATIAVGVARVSSTRGVGLITVDADRTNGVVDPSLWDEVNLWKLYGWFGIHFNDPTEWWGDEWLRRKLPWVRYARVVAPLGGSYAPQIAEACDHGAHTPDHPPTPDCGEGGAPGPAARNETMKWVDGEWVIDYTPFRTSIERIVRSGVKPHINLSGMPVAFSGGTGDFRHYHWNARPPEDLDGWLDFVRGAFEATNDLDRTGWRVSIINEPNCLIPDEDGVIQHVGFAGDPETYARTWVAAARMLAEVAPEVTIHPGNYVVSDSFPGENNLHLYLDALGNEFDRHPDMAWSDLPYIGLSLYEVLGTSIDEFRSVRIPRLYAAQTTNDLPPLPVKLDELGIHQNVREPYEAESSQKIETTLFAASWYAEAVRSFVQAGDVVSAAPWFDAFYFMPKWNALPPLYVYWMLGLLAGQLDDVAVPENRVEVRESGNESGLPRLGVAVSPPRLPKRVSSVRALATKAPDGTVRLLVVHHQPKLVADGDPLQESFSVPTHVAIRGLDGGSYEIRHASVGGTDGAHWTGEALTPLVWQSDGCHQSTGRIRAPHPFEMPANSVWLFEVSPRTNCRAGSWKTLR